MKVNYDTRADAIYIQFKNLIVDHSSEIDKNTILDISKDGQIIGIELLFIKQRKPGLLKELKFEKVMNAL